MIEICEATPGDATFVAWTVLTALDMTSSDVDMDKLVKSCSDDNSLYSWRNSMIAKIDGKSVGCIIAYDGARYREMRDRTWPTLWDDFDANDLIGVEEEAVEGEFYLDSLAVLPEYRGQDIGKLLIRHAVKRGEQLGLSRCTLIADINKTHLHSYYESCGFKEFGKMKFFGHWYYRMES